MVPSLQPKRALARGSNGQLGLKIRPPVLVIVFLVAFFAIIAVHLGVDATPDFRIYHFYNGFAAFHDRSKLDIVPAQLQTMNFNAVDAFDYTVTRLFNHYPAMIGIILSLSYGAAAVCTFVLARLFLPGPGFVSLFVCTAIAVFGLTGAGELPTIATGMTDVTADLPLLAGLAFWMSREREGRNNSASTLVAGLLAGASVRLKLTSVTFFIGWFVMLSVRQFLGVRTAWREAFIFGFFGVVAFLAIDLHWLLHNMSAYGDPIMPNMNNIFKSDYVAHTSWADTRFLPKTTKMAIFYPAYWAFRVSQNTIELPMRDARILIGFLCAILIMLVAAGRCAFGRERVQHTVNTDWLGVYLAIIFLVSYVLWEFEWSIYRYLAIDECLTGVMLLAALRVIWPAAPRLLLAVMLAVIAIPTAATTLYPWWSRAVPAGEAVSVTLPAIEPDAMVLFLDPYAYSYLVPLMPRTVRVIGANNNIIHPGAWGKLQAQAAAAINGHTGPFWGAEFPKAFPGTADATLAYYHLHRDPGSCMIVKSNIENGQNIQMCRLLRD